MNRLAGATSPYLLQHAENPVDWWEWGPEAFAEARERNVPVLLSVGYAACHWCHVMAHESFEDEATAAYLNEHFVSVKVDREERPDVDAVYMQATTAMTGSGGWPMTCVLDHEGVPFFAGTYFPDQPRHGQPAFRQVLQALSQAWTSQPEEVRRVAGSIRDHLRGAVVPAGQEPVDAEVLDQAVETFGAEFDPTNGGFGTAPKFPPSMVLEFLRRYAARVISTGSIPRSTARPRRARLRDARPHARRDGAWWPLRPARRRLRALQRRPRLGGPALREDALRQRAAGRPLRTPRWRPRPSDRPRDRGLPARRARHRQRVRSRPRWTPTAPTRAGTAARARTTRGPRPSSTRCSATTQPGRRGCSPVTDSGTFEEGASTLQLRTDPDDAGRWASVRQRLLDARSGRARPARDDKVVAAWNGLAVSGLVDAGLRLDAPEYLEAAVRCASYLWDVHWVPSTGSGQATGRLRRVSRDGVVGAHAGVLEDYGCLATAYVDLAAATADPVWLERARTLLDVAVARFAAGDGGFFDTADDAEALVSRPRDPADNASPSGLSSLAHALLGYAALTGSGEHRSLAEGALTSVVEIARKAPRFAGWSLAAAEAALTGPVEIAVVGADDDPARAELARVAREASLPGSVVVVAAPGVTGIPLLEGRDLVDGRAAAYVCRDLVCERPVTDVAALREALAR